MRSNLFRSEVLVAQQDHFFGDPVFHQPLSMRALLLATVGFFCVLAGFAASASIKQTESVRGYIYAANGEIKVYSNRNGIIRQLLVSNGQLVNEGQTLALLVNPGYDQSGGKAKLTSIYHIDQQIAQIESRLKLSAERQQLSLDQSKRHQKALSEELLIREEDYNLTTQQMAMAENEFARLESLRMRGAISDSELAQGKNSLISIKKSFYNARIAQQTAIRLWQESEHASALAQTGFRDEQIALQISLSQLRQRLEETKYEQSFALAAPVSGRIDNLLSDYGDQVDTRRPFVSIVADSPAYEAQIFVPSRSLGKLTTGQTVLLNYDAFPAQQYGSAKAVVSSIAKSPIDPREHLVPVAVSEPVYLVKADPLPDQQVANLRAGMQFSARLVTGERTILQGIFAPLTTLSGRL